MNKSSHFIPDATTPEEHLSNVRFQLENAEHWIAADHSGGRQNAAIKAECLLRSAEALVAAFEAEARAQLISAEQSAAVQAATTPAAELPTVAGTPGEVA